MLSTKNMVVFFWKFRSLSIFKNKLFSYNTDLIFVIFDTVYLSYCIVPKGRNQLIRTVRGCIVFGMRGYEVLFHIIFRSGLLYIEYSY